MKVVAFILISVLAIVGFGIFSLNSVQTSAQELTTHFNKLEQSIAKEDWENSLKNLKQISLLWSKTKKSWLLYLDHQEIDNIDLTYIRLSKYVEAKDLSSASAEVAALKLLIKHIPEILAFKLRNIF